MLLASWKQLQNKWSHLYRGIAPDKRGYPHDIFSYFSKKHMLWVYKCHKLWTKISEIKQNVMEDLTKFCDIFLNITLGLPQYSLKSLFPCKKLVKTTTVCDLCLFLYKICCKMVWKFYDIYIFYGNCLPGGQNSVRFYLTVWDMACMSGYSLEGNEYPQHMFLWRNKKNINTFWLKNTFYLELWKVQ